MWMWWYMRLYGMIWFGRGMRADHDQSVRSWVSMESNVGVDIRDGVEGMIGERVRELMNGRSKRRRETKNERTRKRRREHERGHEMKRMEERLVVRNVVTWKQEEIEECMREDIKGRMEVVLSELTADEIGMVWMEENEGECVVIYAKKAGIVLRGWALQMWGEEGQKRWSEEWWLWRWYR